MRPFSLAVGVPAAGIVGSGLLVIVFLAVVARSVSASQYALFGAFWAVALIAGFGVFLPIEQWLAGRGEASPSLADDTHVAARLVTLMVLVEVLVLLTVCGPLLWALGGRLGMLSALVGLCVVSGAQFLARGALIARRRMNMFAAVLVIDVLIRLVFALALSVGGQDTATTYAWAVVAGIGLAHVPVLLVMLPRRHASPVSAAKAVRPVLLLLVGSLGAQVLFNWPAVILAAVAPKDELPEVGTFQAALQLVRVPLFLAVPVQAALVPVLSRVLRGTALRSADPGSSASRSPCYCSLEPLLRVDGCSVRFSCTWSSEASTTRRQK